MNIVGFAKLTQKERIRVKAKLSKQERRDILQPYLPNGRVNRDFFKVYGYVEQEQVEQGEKQYQFAQELWDKQHFIADKKISKYY